MDWLKKMRKAWKIVSARVKLRKSEREGVGVDNANDGSNGLFKLRNDVKKCGYKDVQILWNMLTEMDQLADQDDNRVKVSDMASRPLKRTIKHNSILENLRTNHSTTPHLKTRQNKSAPYPFRVW